MSKILSERMKGRQLTTSFGTFTFDNDGIAEVPDEHVDKLLAIKGYKEVGARTPQNEEKEPKVETNPPKEEKPQNDEQKDVPTDEEPEETKTESEEEEHTEDEEKTDSEEESVKYTIEDLEQIKNVQQLRKIAKDNNIDLNGASKRDEIIPIILGAMN